MATLNLEKKYIIKGVIKAKTGLHIGGTSSGMSIGSADSTVIKHPITDEPFIPGSSLKGKMRSLTELTHGTIGNTKMGAVEYGPTEDDNSIAGRLFGTANQTKTQHPSRIVVRDSVLTDKGKKFLSNAFTEVKTEVVIDRITSKAMPRQIERVVSGAEFTLNLVYNKFKEEKDLIDHVFTALSLVQDDYVGGHGSRGSGQVEFEITDIIERTYQNGEVKEKPRLDDFKAKFKNLFE